MTDNSSDVQPMDEILKNPNHLATISMKAMFLKTANPFGVVISKTPNGKNKAAEDHIV